jgi:uncharacterized protein YoxC
MDTPDENPPEMSSAELIDHRIEVLENRLDELEDPQSSTETPGNDLVTKVNQLCQTVQVLAAKLQKCEHKCNSLTNELDRLRAHSMKCNIIFNFDNNNANFKESKGENCVEIVKMFARSVLGIDKANALYIPVAHRIGRRNPLYTRAIIAKFPISNEFNMIMMNTNRLRDTRHQVTQQLTAKQRERKQFVIPVLKELRSNPDNQAKLFGDKLMVKGKLQVNYLEPKLPPPQLPNQSIKVIPSDSTTDSGSTFTGFAARVTSMQEVSDVLELVKSKPEIASATHLMFAYVMGQKQNFDSDGDYGVGLHLLRHMRDQKMNNMMCIVARDCEPNYSHIGKRRMQHAVSVCEKATTLLQSD